jgi:hypothetical protein
MGVKRKPNQRKHDPRRDHHSIPGQIEKRLEAAAEVWKRRCQGATYATISAEMGLSMGCIHNYIEETRALLREQNKDLAERERDQALALLDNAIEKVVPHINGEVKIETRVERERGNGHGNDKRYFLITAEEWQARMKACQVLVSLLDRKAKLLGMDAPVKVEPPPVVAPETEEQRARARAALRQWTRFQVDPKDFQSTDLS